MIDMFIWSVFIGAIIIAFGTSYIFNIPGYKCALVAIYQIVVNAIWYKLSPNQVVMNYDWFMTSSCGLILSLASILAVITIHRLYRNKK